ncbi:MAG: hypothetical protein EOM28_05735 [Clostridia bacterium]|nr:hypothetical protein [Anaerotignum sp.]NCC15837.1 hypothetical protein [Clostridia bacterium]
MEEKLNSDQMKLLTSMMGAEGSDALHMIDRIERLRHLFGNTEAPKPQDIQMQEVSAPNSPFGSTAGENILFSAIPFLDVEFQKNIFVVARFLELKRVLEGTKLETREKQEDPVYRRHHMLRAVQPFLAAEDKKQLDTMLKVMEIKGVLDVRRDGSE